MSFVDGNLYGVCCGLVDILFLYLFIIELVYLKIM